MIARIIAVSARNPLLVILATLFLVGAGVWAVMNTPLDAIPDLSDTQVIVYTDYPGQAPQVVEDQVTYPLTTALLAVPHSKVVRGFSTFGTSFVYVVFDDGTDLYWARSRVLEYLNFAQKRLPAGVTPSLGPDATGVGWVYEYVVQGKQRTLAELRSLQDWVIRFQLTKASGVAEVAAIGGFERQYQIVVDPRKLQAYGIPLSRVGDAVRQGNQDVGGRTIELTETEYMVRGRGYVRDVRDLERIVLKVDAVGTPVTVGDVARVELGPDERRGIAELDGVGEAVGGIVVKRDGADALTTIRSVRQRIAELLPSLPPGVSIVPVYDRSALILRAIATLRHTLIEESLIVSFVCVVFLLHVRSALVAIVTLPVGVLFAFLAMHMIGVGSNIMSLGGIAIALGAMVDAAIVMIENAHKHVERLAPGEARGPALLAAANEVGPSLFFSLLIITVSFLPVFALEGQEGRLFKPLAYTKTFSMAGGALLAVTLVPVLMLAFVRGRILPEARNPINRVLIALYRPVIRVVLRGPVLLVLLAIGIGAGTIYPAAHLGSEFMPDLNEGTWLYMPVTPPGLSVTKAVELLQGQDRIIKSFPEVQSVFGKAGRAATATDPAPTEMFETVITLKPQSEWPAGMTPDQLKADMNRALDLPGVSNAWTQPIRARIDMLATGIRTPVGVKVFGPDLGQLARIAEQVEQVVRTIPGTTSAFAERLEGGHYLEIIPDRNAIARYGLSVDDVMQVVATALGGQTVTTTVEGRERYGVSVRYPRDLRDDPQAIAEQVLLPTPGGAMIPLGQVAVIRLTGGPPSIRTEDAQLVAYVYVDLNGRDIGGYVNDAARAVRERVTLPQGYRVAWSGQFEYMQHAMARLKLVVPATLVLIFVLLYLNFGRITETLIVLLSVPFALVGGIWLTWWLGYNVSVAVVVGFIALAGVASETGVIMLIYLDNALADVSGRAQAEGRALTRADLRAAIMHGAVERVRPKMMTVTAIMAGLVPILWSAGTGSEVMRRIAAPMVGGMVSSTVLTLLVIPALYALVKGWRLSRG
ncbi:MULTISPECIES: efflux RND transporter permease subunit [Acetobacteraceae]|uniref:Cu(I)/Ag(I) efflux system membrane protein CusA/SilA n=4 Tax=Acetobacteraceae TaxID=433 RepID=A0A850NLW3_9PROT|nr:MULTISPECIES: CusA/CzcA family heavy metal efflux RND transporter [Acetobacteraceae]KXV16815.1 cation transporter [Acetobacter malorum]MBB3173698.1 Cu(I)/Ag(I) efflux system membrane protein CusA/SilA [Endobacter medicaginis]MBU2652988.1 CusA/CzcA family heavy metal efflux RND transporter [Acidomonas methanolica]MCX5475018.1 CusA/CzcA family heavy metal efflux RND transporter [Endobacter medicaginis]NVN28910.1 efflux RND transporter permease subunit [Endobacter medicaginis]